MSAPRWLFLTLLACLILAVSAAPSASTFVLTQASWNFTFSLNVDKNSDDIYFRLVSSADYAWASVGIGSQMGGSLMFVAYEGKDSKAVTISPRIASGNVEPTYAPNINVTLEPGSGILDNRFVVNARCTNCRSWAGGSLDVKSKDQPFIYAWGPSWSFISTDSKSANMQRHSQYGFFDMDMTQASSGDAGVPEGTQNSGASKIGDTRNDLNFPLSIHTLTMFGSFVILFPMGALFIRVISKVKLHYITQSFSLAIVFFGLATGIQLSKLFNMTRNFRTSHQILGLVLIGFLIIQWVLGYVHHREYLRTQHRSVYSEAHLWLGRLVIISGVLNAFLGLHLAGRSTLGFLLIVLIVTGIFAVIYFVIWSRSRRKRSALGSNRATNFRDDDPSSLGNSRMDIPLTDHAAPPAYQEDYVRPPPGSPPNRNRI
ncbi:hypothetical protein GP486_007359 [Trichoglossum hirsutum]|uniref:DOMON domain-containing protein n=1 Tax=Trichoglossum hirsutum TaxID=265104 RepID=A0A9P8IFM9_9PEZI|nr:hypothetical protein GP486_007359 [Trichoglossum hirsutum]